MSDFDDAALACNTCADACDRCAAACLAEPDVQRLTRCIGLDLDCAQVCRLTAALLRRASPFEAAACALCAQICDACGAECSHHDMDHCRACASACKACADACRRLANADRGRAL